MTIQSSKFGNSDPFASYNRSKRKSCLVPFVSGFCWAYACFWAIRNRDQIETGLTQAGLDAGSVQMAMGLGGGCIVLSCAVLIYLLARILTSIRAGSSRLRGTKRLPSGWIVSGMVVATIYTNTPHGLWAAITPWNMEQVQVDDESVATVSMSVLPNLDMANAPSQTAELR